MTSTRAVVSNYFITSPTSPRLKKSGRLEIINNPALLKALFYMDECVAIRSTDKDMDDYTTIWVRIADQTPAVALPIRSMVMDQLRDAWFESTGVTSLIGNSVYEEWLSPEV